MQTQRPDTICSSETLSILSSYYFVKTVRPNMFFGTKMVASFGVYCQAITNFVDPLQNIFVSLVYQARSIGKIGIGNKSNLIKILNRVFYTQIANFPKCRRNCSFPESVVRRDNNYWRVGVDEARLLLFLLLLPLLVVRLGGDRVAGGHPLVLDLKCS